MNIDMVLPIVFRNIDIEMPKVLKYFLHINNSQMHS